MYFDVIELCFKKLDEAAKLPVRGKPGDAGLDLHSIEHVTLLPGEMLPVRTGLAVELPSGTFGAVRGRSGMAFKEAITAFEGTIDAGYRGEINVLLLNSSDRVYEIYPGDRIAQIVVVPYLVTKPVFVSELSDTERGSNGYGHTGR